VDSTDDPTLVLTAAFLRPFPSVIMAQADEVERQKNKVGICHRTGSDRHPYVFIEIDESAESAHIGRHAHPPIDGEEDFKASGPEECRVKRTTTVTKTITTAVTKTPTTTVIKTITTTITTTFTFTVTSSTFTTVTSTSATQAPPS
jgi:hypothetical protein